MSTPRLQLIRARWIAPMDRPPIRDGAVVFRADRITQVGDAAALARTHRDVDHHDLGAAVLMPGLINAHVHLELSDTPKPGDRWPGPLADWLIEIIKNAPPDGDMARVSGGIDAGVKQCLGFGVTTVGDITRQPALTRPLLRESPLRVVSFGEFQAMAARRDLLDPRFAAATDRTCESERLRVGVSPHAPYSVEPNGFRRAVESGLPLATHLAESRDESGGIL